MSDDVTVRLQESLTPERIALIAEAEKVFLSVHPEKLKQESTLGELIEEAIKAWMEVKVRRKK